MEPSADDIRRVLERILASSGFANAERMSRFLRYVVERSLAGESEQIKEYAIGVDVFGRNADYDPRLDSIVRVEARRLRSKLDEYYVSEGKDEDVVISIRRGTYVPVFERRRAEPVTAMPTPKTDAALPVPAQQGRRSRAWVAMALVIVAIVSVAAWRQGLLVSTRATPSVSVAVLPFTHYSTDTEDALLAGRMTEDVTSELARLGVARVIAHTSVRQFAGTSTPAPQIAESLNADLLIEGSVARSGSNIDTSIRLIGGRSNHKLWVNRFTGTVNDSRDLARQIASAMATAIQGRAETRRSQ